MAVAAVPGAPAFERWIPLARQVVRTSLRLRWKDVFEIYSYVPTVPLAEALALEARRAGADTHITLMTDDLWFTSMHELSTRWLRQPSPVEVAINTAITADVYLGGPGDARRMRDIPPAKFEANSEGGRKQDAPHRRRRVRHVDLPIGRVTHQRAEAYGLDYGRWYRSYHEALAVDLTEIQRRGAALARTLATHRRVHATSDAGTDLRFRVKPVRPAVEDGIVSADDVRRGLVEATLPAGRIEGAVRPDSVEGEVRATDPIFYGGRLVARPWFRIRAGRIVAHGADAHADLLKRMLTGPDGARARVGWFTIGLNRFAEPCMLDNSIVKDDLGIGLGPHPQLERRSTEPGGSFHATTGPVRLAFER